MCKQTGCVGMTPVAVDKVIELPSQRFRTVFIRGNLLLTMISSRRTKMTIQHDEDARPLTAHPRRGGNGTVSSLLTRRGTIHYARSSAFVPQRPQFADTGYGKSIRSYLRRRALAQ